MYIYIYKAFVVTVVGDRNVVNSSNPGRDYLHFTLPHWEMYEPNDYPTSYG